MFQAIVQLGAYSVVSLADVLNIGRLDAHAADEDPESLVVGGFEYMMLAFDTYIITHEWDASVNC